MSDQSSRELLAELLERSIQVWTENGESSESRLSLRAPRGTLDADLQAALRDTKSRLIALLKLGHKYAPPSFAQERLLFLDRLENRGDVDHAPLAWHLEGPVDEAALGAALTDLTTRHEPLRTVFDEFEGRAAQIVEPPRTVELRRLDLSGLPPTLAEAAAHLAGSRLAKIPFDLRRGPLLSAWIFRISPGVYRLLLVLHHIATDGWSTAILERELGELYAARLERRPHRLPVLRRTYADHASAERSALRGAPLADHLAFWRHALEPPLPVLDLPLDRRRPQRRRYRGAARSLIVDAIATKRLESMARRAGASLFMALLSIYAVLLRHITGEREFVVGSPTAGRGQRDSEDLIGFFVNMLALRLRVTPGLSFNELLLDVRERVLGAFAHQDLPFEKVAEELAEPRDLRRPPIFQTSLVLQNTPSSRLDLSGITTRIIEVARYHSPYEVSAHLQSTEGGLAGRMIYEPDLFDSTTVERLARSFTRLSGLLAAHPDRELDNLSLLGAVEHHQIVVEWADGGPAAEPELALHELFARRAAMHPDAVAVEHQGETLSYGELARRARRLGERLRRQGVGLETTVAINAAPSFELLVGILGVLEAGAAFLPLEPEQPRERRRIMLEIACPKLVLTRDQLAADDEQDEQDGAAFPAYRKGADHAAYVLFTSGSTGRPRGVVVSHRAYGRYLAWRRRDLGPSPGERVLHKGSLLYDGSLWEIFEPLLRGALVLIAPSSARQDAALLARGLADWRIDAAGFVPGLLAMTAGEAAALPRRLTVSGEALPQALARRLAAASEIVVNLYGPAEAVAASTFWRCDLRRLGSSTAPIGRPVAGRRVQVLNTWDRPRPIGAPGEIYLGGSGQAADGLARGYLEDPRSTAASFGPDPWTARPGARLYRTGDRGRWRADGELEFLGRRDRQVQIRGMRCELGEIEAALEAHEAVRRAAVVLLDESPEPHLMAWAEIRPESGEPTGRDGWLDFLGHDFLAARLPPAMWPERLEIVERLPLLPAGKVDRRALAARAREVGIAANAPNEPCGDVERAVAAVFSKVLGKEAVDRDDSFFELGGHSLVAARVTARLGERLGAEIGLRTLFESPTPRRLAKALASTRSAGDARPWRDRPIPRRPRGTRIELSSAQERLWLLEQLDPGPAYNMPSAWRLDGELETAALASAFAALLTRHEAWRTRFPAGTDGRPKAIVRNDGEYFLLPNVDLRGLPLRARSAALRRLRLREAARPFDLAAGPLLRAVLPRLAEHRHLLLINVHHMVSDGASQRLLKSELAELYRAAVEGRPPVLSSPPLRYSDFAAWQRRRLSGQEVTQWVDFWRQRLAELESFALPVDRQGSGSLRGGASCPLPNVPGARVLALRSLGQSTGATLYMVLLAAAFALLRRLGTGGEPILGAPVSERGRPELENVAGCFVNLLPLRSPSSDGLTFALHLARVRNHVLSALAHQELPFDRLVEELEPERGPRRHPFFQMTFDLQPVEPEEWSLPAIESTTLTPVLATARFDLEFHLFEESSSLGPMIGGAFFYDAHLFDATTVGRWARSWSVLLAAIVDGSRGAIEALPVLTAAERQQVTVEWSEAAQPPHEEELVHGLIEKSAVRSPDARALVWEVENSVAFWSYSGLLHRATGLADRLRAHGVGPESRVIVMLDRSPKLPMTWLAVLMAGGAFVPVDPDLPPRRLAFLLVDARPRLVVSEEKYRSRIPAGIETAPEVLLLDLQTSWSRMDPSETALPKTRPDNAAYVIYTSGSTGKPKGVVIAHRPYRWQGC